MYTFVTGGHRSGRSNYALRRASELGPPPWLYVTAGEETDDAIKKRIERYRRDAEAIWRTTVMPRDLLTLLEPAALDGTGALVLDGFFAWLGGRIAAAPPELDSALIEEVAGIADRLYRSPVPVVLVSLEVGLGGAPESRDAQRILRVAGSANQILAGMASAVVLMVSGVPMKIR